MKSARKSIDQEAIRCVKALDSHNRMLTRDFISILGDRILCVCMYVCVTLLQSEDLGKSFAPFRFVSSRLGVKVRNMKMDFNTGGTWRQVGQ